MRPSKEKKTDEKKITMPKAISLKRKLLFY